MTEINGMTAADIAATEYYDGHSDHDDQPFEGNIVLVDARALSDTDRTVVESMREEFDAQVVVLPHPSVTKKKMRRSRATISDVGLDEIGDYIEPESKIAVIPGPGLRASSRDSVLAPIPDDCTSEMISASSLQDAMDGLGKFFGVRHSQESTGESGPTAEDFMDGLDEDKTGSKSGYGLDIENGRMGVWTASGSTGKGEPRLEFPMSLYGITGTDDKTARQSISQAAIWIEEEEREITYDGDLAGYRVRLAAITEEDAKSPGPRRVRRTRKPIEFGDIRTIERPLKALNLIGEMPFPTSQNAKNSFFQMVVGASKSRGYPKIDVHQAVGYLMTDTFGLAFVKSDGAIVVSEGKVYEVDDIRGVTPRRPETGQKINVTSGDRAKSARRICDVVDTMTPNGKVTLGSILANGAALATGLEPTSMMSLPGRASLGKTSAIAWCDLFSSTLKKDSFVSMTSTANFIDSSMIVGNGVPAYIDDARQQKTQKKKDEQAAAIDVAIRVGYGSTTAARQRLSSTDGNVKAADSNAPQMWPGITLTSENTLDVYSPISASDRTRIMEVKFESKPTDDQGRTLEAVHKAGHLTTVGYEIIKNALLDLEAYVAEGKSRRASMSGLQAMQGERALEYHRDENDVEHFDSRVEATLAFYRFGAAEFIRALDGFPEAQEAMRGVFESAEHELWVPQANNVAQALNEDDMSLGATLMDAIVPHLGGRAHIFRYKSTSSAEDRVTNSTDSEVIGRVIEGDHGELGVFLVPSLIRGARIIDSSYNETRIKSELRSVTGAYLPKNSVRVNGEPSRGVFIPAEHSRIDPDSQLWVEYERGKNKSGIPKSDPEF